LRKNSNQEVTKTQANLASQCCRSSRFGTFASCIYKISKAELHKRVLSIWITLCRLRFVNKLWGSRKPLNVVAITAAQGQLLTVVHDDRVFTGIPGLQLFDVFAVYDQ
jgi:hypothetical protein